MAGETWQSRQTQDEVRRDASTRRPEGGRRDVGRPFKIVDHLDSDWAGRLILKRWLAGRGDWHITDDPDWTRYMQNSQLLTNSCVSEVSKIVNKIRAEGKAKFFVNRRCHMEVENGEGIIGYQYLHGSNADVGNFLIFGSGTYSRSRKRESFSLKLKYQWNDMIDPNKKYDSDSIKAVVGKVISVGQATDYHLRITWACLLYTSPSPRDQRGSRMPSSA